MLKRKFVGILHEYTVFACFISMNILKVLAVLMYIQYVCSRVFPLFIYLNLCNYSFKIVFGQLNIMIKNSIRHC